MKNQEKNNILKNKDFTTSILVNKSPMESFNAVVNLRGWWSEEIVGSTDKLNEEFYYHFEDIHKCKMKMIELIPSKKVVWLVLENYFDFTKDKSEWIDTKIIFELSKKGNKTHIKFTHVGLVPKYECYQICENAWTDYIQNSLFNLISTGKGMPNPKEVKANKLKV